MNVTPRALAEKKSETPVYALAGKRVFVAGHRGMVGQALVRRLRTEGCVLLTVGREELDLRRQTEVENWFYRFRPEVVFHAAATVGGILANSSRPADFLYDNLMIEANLAAAAHEFDVERLLMLGSSCIYPREAPQPIEEGALLSGPLEATNQWYAVAKIAGLKLCEAYRAQFGCDFISAMPTNLYGPGDNFDLAGGHVIPALMRKLHEAKLEGRPRVEIWGSGRPRREFLHVDDCADALVFLMTRYVGASHVNIGCGSDLSIAELARTIAEVVGYEGGFEFDISKPDGTPRKLLDVERLGKLGWRARIPLKDGLKQTYAWYLAATSQGSQASRAVS